MNEQSDNVVVEPGLKVPMRDGTLLDAMLWRPAAPGQYPVLIERVAYEFSGRAGPNGRFYASHGYALLAQSVRGTYASEGEFTMMRDDGWGEHQDGYDTIEWAALQSWSNGQVGMIDGSYSGCTQYLVAPTRPLHLRALFARQSTGDLKSGWFFPGGAHPHGFTRRWIVSSLLAPQLGRRSGQLSEESTRHRIEQAAAEADQWIWHLPLASWPPIEGLADWYWEMLDHVDDESYWAPITMSKVADEVDTPILHFGGWFDVFLSGTLQAFTEIRARGRSVACREAQRLIVGPWIHGPNEIGRREVGALDFGPEAIFDLQACRLRWYDHWLKGAQNGAMDDPPVRVFLMGTNRWLGFAEWPPADANYRPLHLASDAEAATHAGSARGRLTFDAPPVDDVTDTFTYDPADPVPSLVAGLQTWPVDQRPIEDRVLTYTSLPLDEDLHVVGPVKATLHAASSAPDTDWVVRLCDVWPDGRSITVCEGILRARYRESFTQPVLMEPGQVYRFEVDLRATAQTFLACHRLRLHVTSSSFPFYDRNLNTGGKLGKEAAGQVATNTVYHDIPHPSHVLLPILSSDAVERYLRTASVSESDLPSGPT